MNFRLKIMSQWVIAETFKEGKIYDYEDVVKCAQEFGNPDILHDSAFSYEFKPGQKFRLERVPLVKVYAKGRSKKESPSGEMFLEGGSEDEKYAQKFSRDHANGDSAGPIIVKTVGSEYQILDGRHRCRAAFLRGEKDIRAFVAASD